MNLPESAYLLVAHNTNPNRHITLLDCDAALQRMNTAGLSQDDCHLVFDWLRAEPLIFLDEAVAKILELRREDIHARQCWADFKQALAKAFYLA